MCLTTAACLQPVSSAPSRLQRFNHERRAERTVAKGFVCPLSLVLTGVKWEVGGNYTLCGKAVEKAQLALVEITAIAKLMGH